MHTVQKCKIIFHRNIFHEISSLETSLVETLLSRNFCQKCVKVNYGILQPLSFRKNSVKVMFYQTILLKIDLAKKNLRGSEFLVFPHCDGQTHQSVKIRGIYSHQKIFRQINSLVFCRNIVFTKFLPKKC